MSNVNELVPVGLVASDPFVETALTLTVPWPKAVTSPAVSTTAWAAPVPVTVLLSVAVPRVKVTMVLEPVSEF